LLGLARKGDPKAISKLFELYQVRVLNGDMLSKLNKSYYKAAAAQEQKASQASSKPAKGQGCAWQRQEQSEALHIPACSSRQAQNHQGNRGKETSQVKSVCVEILGADQPRSLLYCTPTRNPPAASFFPISSAAFRSPE
jgi:hypothetical protein